MLLADEMRVPATGYQEKHKKNRSEKCSSDELIPPRPVTTISVSLRYS